MRRSVLVALGIALILLAPLAAAVPGPGATPGLGTACGASGNEKPCRGIIFNTTATGTTTYTGGWIVVGTVVVTPGATVNFVDASLDVRNSSAGFIAKPGATLNFVRTVAQESTSDAPFELVARPESTFVLNASTIVGGLGVTVETSAASVSGNLLAGIPRALLLDGVTTTIHHNTFRNNGVAVNQTGGVPTLDHNVFEGGDTCVRDWQSDPTIVHNTFRGCHVGIWHEQSHSVINFNDMEDEVNPPGAGVWVLDGNSPVLEGNRIAKYGTGIRITNARAFVRNNTIEQNVGAGILVEGNSGPMDVQGNLVRDNGGHGIALVGAVDVPVFGNTVQGNGGHGITLVGTPNARVQDNLVSGNAGVGLLVDATSPGALLAGNAATANGLDGLRVLASGATLNGGSSNGNGGHGVRIQGAANVHVDGLVANGNAGDGLFIGGSSAIIARTNASLNARNGFTYDPMGPLALLADTELTLIRAMGNGGSGLQNVEGNATSVADGWFQGNLVAGVKNDDVTSFIDARNSYWGAASGPRHAANPLGTGDRVEGNVLYVPFRAAPP